MSTGGPEETNYTLLVISNFATLIRWVETFYNDITSCVLNNGICTPYFELKRGVRQGDQLSPYLFIIAAEILAVTIRSREDILIGKLDEVSDLLN